MFSHGFHAKVTLNPDICGEPRNQAIILSADGIPFFRDLQSNRKGYPCGMRLANPPEQVGKSLPMTHLVCLMACEFWEMDENTKKPKRVYRGPKCLQPMQLRIADELYQLYHVGVRVVDHSLAHGAAERDFWVRVVLLFWIGDYPGQGECSGFKYVYHICAVVYRRKVYKKFTKCLQIVYRLCTIYTDCSKIFAISGTRATDVVTGVQLTVDTPAR